MDAYEYGLPQQAIAQQPAEPRSSARLLVAPGLAGNQDIAHTTMADLPSLLARVTWWSSTTPGCWPDAWPCSRPVAAVPRSCCWSRWRGSRRCGRPWSARRRRLPASTVLLESRRGHRSSR